MKKRILILLIMLLFPGNIFALKYGGCDVSEISRLKSLESNINLYYDYYMGDYEPVFSVTITNIPPNVYFRDSNTNKYYYYSNTNNGEITINGYNGQPGSYKFYSSLENCSDILLGTKYYNFPSYNRYYNNYLCEGLDDFSLCQKWADVKYDSEQFQKMVNEYKNNKTDEEEIIIEYKPSLLSIISDFYAKYYYYFLPIIIVIGIIVIIIDRKKNKFKL